MTWVTENAEGVSIAVVVQPRAGRTEVKGEHGDALKIRLAAPPVEGAANDELIAFLAKSLGVRRDEVSLRSGASSKRKVVTIRGVTAKLVQERLCGR